MGFQLKVKVQYFISFPFFFSVSTRILWGGGGILGLWRLLIIIPEAAAILKAKCFYFWAKAERPLICGAAPIIPSRRSFLLVPVNVKVAALDASFFSPPHSLLLPLFSSRNKVSSWILNLWPQRVRANVIKQVVVLNNQIGIPFHLVFKTK